MELVVQKLDAKNISKRELIRYSEIVRMGSCTAVSLEDLYHRIQYCDNYACYDGNTMAAVIQVKPNYPYFNGSIYIQYLRPDWRYNKDDVLAFTVRETIKTYTDYPQSVYVSTDVRRKCDLNRSLFNRMGFKDTLLRCPLGREYVTMVTTIDKLIKE